jgi:hypothetical protein
MLATTAVAAVFALSRQRRDQMKCNDVAWLRACGAPDFSLKFN